MFLQILPSGDNVKDMRLELEGLDSSSGFVTVVWASVYSSVEWEK